MQVKLTPQLLTETLSRLSGFVQNGDKPIIVTYSTDDTIAADFDTPSSEGVIDTNRHMMKVMSILAFVMYKHASGEPIILKEDQEVKQFMDYFAGVTTDIKDQKNPEIKISTLGLDDDQILEGDGDV